MPRKSILSDDLLRQLVAVGQVDVLVGVPTFNHAATIGEVVTRVHTGLAAHFPRERTVLINPDGGSDDGTMECLRAAPMAAAESRGSATLRTTHRVSALHAGGLGGAGGMRAVFASADLLQARAVVLLDADVVTLEPEWIGALARPPWAGEADLTIPIHPRPRYDGALLSQLVRPLLSAVYARRLQSTVIGAFGCSGRFAARLAALPVWEADPSRPALDVILVASALAEDFRLTHAHLGPCTFAARPRPPLPELFGQVVGAAFACLERDAPAWLGRGEPAEVPISSVRREAADAESPVDPAPMIERFRSGVRDLAPLLGEILTSGTLARLQAAAASEEAPRIPDPLWATTVYEFAASHHRGVMTPEHLTQALVPLYLGRTASFFAEIASATDEEQRERLATLQREFEGLRPTFVEHWNGAGGR